MANNRYKDIFNIESANQTVPGYSIKDRSTDLYLEYHDGDRLDNLSYRVYGSPQYWWIILTANGYTIEFDIEAGEILRIPLPLADVLDEISEQAL